MSQNSRAVELHFIDGPLQGTRKMEDASILNCYRTYRHLSPTDFHAEKIIPSNTDQTWVQKTCIEYHYLPFRLPTSYSGPERYAMCLEKGLN